MSVRGWAVPWSRAKRRVGVLAGRVVRRGALGGKTSPRSSHPGEASFCSLGEGMQIEGTTRAKTLW